MKVKVTRSVQSWYYDNRTIEFDIPNDVEDVKVYLEEQMEDNDEIEDKFWAADVESEFSDPEHLYYEVVGDDGKLTEWQDY
jgi:hypothetical protein